MKKMKTALSTWNGRMGRSWLALAIVISLIGTLPAKGTDAYLYASYQEGSELGGNYWQGDGGNVPIIILTDSDTPEGTHTLSYGGFSRSNVTITIGAGGVVIGGSTVDTIPLGAYYWVDDMSPTLAPAQAPTPVTDNYTVYLDAGSTTYTPQSQPLNVTSTFKWNYWFDPADAPSGPPDPTLGYEDVFSLPTRYAESNTFPLYFYIPGTVVQDPINKNVYTCSQGCASCKNMAVASLDKFQAGISISDAPVGYTPPVGQSMYFQATYHQRLTNQPSTFNFSNLGPQWNCNWVSYISGGPANNSGEAIYFAPGGSQYAYGGYQEIVPSTGGSTFVKQGDFTDNQGWNLATLHYRQSPERYERWLPDGTTEVFAQPAGTSPNRLFFLTSITDPQGNVTTLTYDSTAASNGYAILTAVTDPLGQQLLFSYNSSNGLEISKVTRSTDGLSAKFEYTNGQLSSSTDTIGITSSFQYTSGTNFINAMTTPYGTTTFSSTDGSGYHEADMTNPLGQTERVEYQESLSTSLVSGSDSSAPSATGLTIDNSNLNLHNSFYWSRREYADGLAAGSLDSGPFYAKAEVSHWAESGSGSVPVPLSTKRPLEARVWYNYPGQPDDDTVDVTASGAMVVPSVTARVLDGSATQASFASYNPNGMITQSIDPIGRTTNYNYASNNIDLLTVTQANSGTTGGQDLLSTMTYDGQHDPLTVTDAAGQVTTMTYNTQGQLTSKTVTVSSAAQTTTLTYTGPGGSGTGNYLTLVTGPISGATTSYTYDSAERVHTVTDSEGYTLTTAYDNLDRPTSTTYPDSTTDLTYYNKLDVAKTVDRQGRTTKNVYDAIRELLQTTDPLGRTTKYTWCLCGGLSTLTDANNHVTTWGLDTQGRVTSKTYADSSTINYVYETNESRLHTMTDAVGNVATYAYNVDNTLSGTTYTPASGVASTPNVSFSYDSVYNRVTSMGDGTGTTSYSYNPINASLGAGRLSSVSVPIAGSSATVTYSYDELGRVVTRDVDHSSTNANNVSTTFDALGRVTGVSNALGAFTYAYVDETSRLSGVTYPSGTGLTTSYSYFGNTGDQRLETIQNFKSGTTNVSKFDYTYNAVGTIATWTTQADSSTAIVNTLSYDNADQLTSAVQSGGGSASDAYGYDPAGNRLSEVTGSGTTAGQFNDLNQLTRLSSSTTSQTVAGHTSAAITSATVNAVPATISSSTNFTANVALPAGTNIVSVVATPTTNNIPITTQQYQFVTTGSTPTTLAYDANGNITTDENGNNYKWDALNRLTAIIYNSGTYSGTHTEFAYDGLSRRVSIVERAGTTVGSGTVSSTKNYLWIGSEMAEERDASNTVTKRFFPQGEQQSGTDYYYTSDHLGSVRELCSSTGAIVARYSYDPYGRTTLVSGSNLATFQYAGMQVHQASGLYVTTGDGVGDAGRFYDAGTGRWLSRDPLEEQEGENLYEYVGNNAIYDTDPSGLLSVADCIKLAKRIKKLENLIKEKKEDLDLDRGNLPGKVPGDSSRGTNPGDSRRGHWNKLSDYKRTLAALKARYDDECEGKTPTCKAVQPATVPASTPAPATAPTNVQPSPAPSSPTPTPPSPPDDMDNLPVIYPDRIPGPWSF